MSLIDDLRKLHLPPSHLPTASEISTIVGALVGYAEHGDELLKAGEKDIKAVEKGEPADNVDKLFSPPPEETGPASPAPAANPPSGAPAPDAPGVPAAPSPDAAEWQEFQTWKAQQQRTQAAVSSDPVPEPPVGDETATPTEPPPAV